MLLTINNFLHGAGTRRMIMKWIIENYEAVLTIVGSTVATLALIAKLTPSPKDDGVIAKVLEWLKLVPKAK